MGKERYLRDVVDSYSDISYVMKSFILTDIHINNTLLFLFSHDTYTPVVK